MEFQFYDDAGEPYTLPGVMVSCSTPGCENENILIEVADDPAGCVLCGPCGAWIIAPANNTTQES